MILDSGHYYSLLHTSQFQYFPPFCKLPIQYYGLLSPSVYLEFLAGAKKERKQKWKHNFPPSFSSWLCRVLWLSGTWSLAETLWCGQSVTLHEQQVNTKIYRLSGLCLHDRLMWPPWSLWSSRIWLTCVREGISPPPIPSPYFSLIPVDAHDLHRNTHSVCQSVSISSAAQQDDDVDEQQANEDEGEVNKELLQVPLGLRVHLNLGRPANSWLGHVLDPLHGWG